VAQLLKPNGQLNEEKKSRPQDLLFLCVYCLIAERSPLLAFRTHAGIRFSDT
jgi:hypothetical protein